MKTNEQKEEHLIRGWARPMRAIAMTVALVGVVATASAAEDELAIKAAANVVVEVGPPVTPYIFDGDLRDLPPAPEWQPGDPIKYVPKRYYPTGDEPIPFKPDWRDPLVDLQRSVGRSARAFSPPLLSFAGQGYSGAVPADPVGEIGPTYYIQAINGTSGSLFRVYDKVTGAPVTAAIAMESLGTGNCASGFGDPIILYDEAASRWVLTEFSEVANSFCIYISQSVDPVAGGWFAYEFTAPNFPDYPKYGVWLNSYLATTNEGIPAVYAFDRTNMLAGTAATSQRFTAPELPGFPFEALTPADHDGSVLPPPNSPAIVGRHRDDESHDGANTPLTDLIELWEVSIDWAVPANSTITQLPSISISDFDSNLCGLTSFSCIPQPGGGGLLDPVREVLMWRFQYRNMGTHETLVGSLVTDVGDFQDHAGVRWFELRKVGAGAWTLQQEGTYSPDSSHRWMSGASMDMDGNMAIAYSTTNPATGLFASLAYTGRLVFEAPGIMTQPETMIAQGTGTQSGIRWGDYSSLNVDPEDGCTFWYTMQYMPGNQWGTWISAFKFDSCNCASVPASPVTFTAVVGADNEARLDWSDSATANAAVYIVSRSETPGGPYTEVTQIPDSSPGVGSGAPYMYVDTGLSGGATYYYVIMVLDDIGCQSVLTQEQQVTPTGPCLYAPSFFGLQAINSSANCTLELVWAPGLSNCSGTITYDIHRDTVPGFTPGAVNRIATGRVTTNYIDAAVGAGVTYYYIVRAIDSSGGQSDGNTTELASAPGGPDVGPVNFAGTGATPIADNGSTTVDAIVGNSGPLRSITVNVDITHTWVGDLTLTLIAPDATSVVLLDQPGVPATPFGCGNDNMVVTFDDASAFNLETHCAGTTPWYTGTAAPSNPLSGFAGTSINGTWQLLLEDAADFDTGTLNSWSLDIVYGGPCAGGCSVASFSRITSLRGVEDAAGTGIDFSWSADPVAPPFYHVNLVNDAPIMLQTPGPHSTAAGTIRCAVGTLGCNDATPPAAIWNGTLFYQVMSACDMNIGNEGPF